MKHSRCQTLIASKKAKTKSCLSQVAQLLSVSAVSVVGSGISHLIARGASGVLF
jgi:hypothetical protein